MLSLSIPEHVEPIRQKVLHFIEQEIYPVEAELLADKVSSRNGNVMKGLMQKAKDQGLWALGHPEEIGGGGLPFMDYVFVNEVVGRSEIATVALGTALFGTGALEVFAQVVEYGGGSTHALRFDDLTV